MTDLSVSRSRSATPSEDGLFFSVHGHEEEELEGLQGRVGRRGEILFDMSFMRMKGRTRELEQREGRRKISLSVLLNEYASWKGSSGSS